MALEPFIIEWKKQQEKQRDEKEIRIPLQLPLHFPLPLPHLKKDIDNNIIIPSTPHYDSSNGDNSPHIEEEGGFIYIPLHNNNILYLYKV